MAACSTPGREITTASARPLPVTHGRVVTNLDLLASGRVMVDEYAASLPEPERERLRAAIARGSRATVGVHARFDVSAFSAGECTGTGVLVAGSDGSLVVLTAGHTFVEAGPAPQVRVSTRGGPELAGDLVACEAGASGLDFAVVRCTGAPPADAAPVVRAAPRRGALVVALGYPDRYGVDGQGHLRRLGPPGSPSPEPLALLLEVTQVEPLVLVPVAGAVPLGGFSGGGLFDLDGNVIGVLTAEQQEWEPGGDTVIFRVLGCSVAAMHSIP